MGLRYALIVANPNTLQLFDEDGSLLKKLTVDGWSYAEAGVTIDSQGNVYTKEWDLIKKYDSDLNLLFTKDIDDPAFYFIAVSASVDGYIYTLENNTPITRVNKRDASDLSIVDTITLTAMWSYDGPMCLDSDGNIYVFQDPYVEKWSSAGVLLARIDVGAMSNEYAGCGVCGNYVYFVKDTNEVHYAPLDLSSYSTWNLPSNIAYALAATSIDLIISGWDGDGHGATSKYDSGRNLIWTKKLNPTAQYAYKAGAIIIPIVVPTITTATITNILPNKANGGGEITDTGGEDCTKRGVCWNLTGSPTISDNIVEEEGTFGIESFVSILTGLTPVTTIYVKAYAYNSAGYGYGEEVTFNTLEDFPLYPIIFPSKLKVKDVKKNCIIFENSMSDICLTLNHNTIVVREYLQAAYEGSDYDESSNLRDVLPSQQLVKLLNKDVDLTAIINNFISNISDMFLLINDNSTLVKQWLDDYEPDEEAHGFIDVKMKPIIVGKDLSKAMDDLFEGMEDNILILNNNIEVMKERF